MNDSIEFPNQRIYTAHEKEAITLTYSLENLFKKNLLMTVQHEEECNTKKVQHEKSATRKSTMKYSSAVRTKSKRV